MPKSQTAVSPTLTSVRPSGVGFAGTTKDDHLGHLAGRLIVPGGAIILAIFVALQVAGFLTRPSVSIDFAGPPPPPVTFETIDGDAVTIDGGTRGPLVLYFMASWCGACGPEAMAWSQASQGSGAAVYLVDVDPFDSPESLRGFAEAYGLSNVGLVLDDGGRIARALDARSLDATVVIRDGRIIYRDAFPTPNHVVDEVMRSL